MSVVFVYVTDLRGYELTIYSAVSLALSQPAPFDIHIFCYHFSPQASDRTVEVLSGFGVRLIFSQIRDPDIEKHPVLGHVTTPSLLKLSAVQDVIGQYERVVYLDGDILVFRNLKLTDIHFGDKPLAAVVDMDPRPTGPLRHFLGVAPHTAQIGPAAYFNSGFMIFDHGNWKESFIQDYASSLTIHESGCPYKTDCVTVDQCALNHAFAKRWTELSVDFNTQASLKFTALWKVALVRHYCGVRKFWPVSAFRSDGRDVKLLRRIRRTLSLPFRAQPIFYDVLYKLNYLRNRRLRREMEEMFPKVYRSGRVLPSNQDGMKWRQVG